MKPTWTRGGKAYTWKSRVEVYTYGARCESPALASGSIDLGRLYITAAASRRRVISAGPLPARALRPNELLRSRRLGKPENPPRDCDGKEKTPRSSPKFPWTPLLPRPVWLKFPRKQSRMDRSQLSRIHRYARRVREIDKNAL